MKISQIGILALVCSMACKSEREAPNGLKVNVIKEGTGEFAVPGQFLITSMIIKDAKDSVWRDTHIQDLPMIIPVADETAKPNEKGVESAFRVMKKGDSVSIAIDAKTLFGEQPMPPNVKPEDKMTFVFCVKDVVDQQGVEKIQQELQAKQVEKNRKEQEGRLAMDTVAIDSFLASRSLNAVKDKSGMRYIIQKLGKGAKPTISSTITFKYKGVLMENGMVFDESAAPVVYPLARLIPGWQIVFQLFPKGTSATLYVPSSLGYGVSGYQPGIPPNANLIFDVELVDFKD
jgi:FKBP-type peptidyl-prolyl cis-trans isomerase